MSEEGDKMKEARKVPFSGEVIMESVGSPEEEIKLNTLLPIPHIIPYFSSSPPFFPQV